MKNFSLDIQFQNGQTKFYRNKTEQEVIDFLNKIKECQTDIASIEVILIRK